MKHTRSHTRTIRRLRARTLLMFFLCAWCHDAIAQKKDPSPDATPKNSTEKDFVVVNERNKKDNSVKSASFTKDAPYRKGMGGEILEKHVKLKGANHELKLLNSTATKKQTTVEKYQQYYKGIKVEHGQYSIMYDKEGKAAFMNGNYYAATGDVDATPKMSINEARDSAIATVKAEKYAWQIEGMERALKNDKKDSNATYYPKGELVFIEDKTVADPDRKQHLAYKFDVYAMEPLSREAIYVDASDGKILCRNTRLTDIAVSGNSLYSGNVNFEVRQPYGPGTNYFYQDLTRGAQITTYQAIVIIPPFVAYTGSIFEVPTLPPPTDAATDAHWAAEQVYDYWSNIHGRNSFDGAGATMKSLVHFGTGMANAFWDGTNVVYGDGNASSTAWTSLDICGHEWGHAICDHTATLIYQSESGAMNEGFSDIWGAVVENYADPHESDATAKDNWAVAEEIAASPIRSMSNPNAHGQPDTYGGTNWVPTGGCVPSGANDNCGVHTNSGVLNHWFYLIANGGTGVNDIGNAFAVTGIGMTTAAEIAYNTELVLTGTSDYMDCRVASLQVAATLYGLCSPEVDAVYKAWYAVGVGPNSPLSIYPSVCLGSTNALIAPLPGGAWASSDPAIASIDPSTGVATGVAVGVCDISYTLGACTVTMNFTVSPVPTAITGGSTVCVGYSIALACTPGSGAWSSSNTYVATVNPATGVVTGVASGTTIITYAVSPGCFTTTIVTTNDNPIVIVGSHLMCQANNSYFTAAPTGGTWSSSNAAVALANLTTGNVAGIAPGSAVISYTLSTGCFLTYPMTVSPTPGPITGTSNVCVGSTRSLSCLPAGGTWSSYNSTIADVDAVTGVVSGISAGTVGIFYTNSAGCSRQVSFTVLSIPEPITGATSICAGATSTLSSITPPGFWQSSNPGVAPIAIWTGVVTGSSVGSSTVTYNAGGCTTTTVFNVYPIPGAITGATTVCEGSNITLSNPIAGGSWTCYSGSGAATIDPATGVLTGTSAGTVTVDYTSPGGCFVSGGITVLNTPTIAEGASVMLCTGSTTTLHGSIAGGTWTSSNAAMASVDPASGVVTTGSTSGSATISYTLSSGCAASAVVYVTNPSSLTVCASAPYSSCDNNLTFCGDGFTVTVSGAPAGSTYSWSPAISGYSSMSSSVSGGILTSTYVFSSLPATQTYTISTAVGCGISRTIVKPVGSCSPCETLSPGCVPGSPLPAFKTVTATVLNSSVVSPTVPGYYYVVNNADLTVSPAPGSVFVMAPAVAITIPKAADVLIESSHLLSAAGASCKWTGLFVQSNPSGSGKLTLRNSLIENTNTAGVTVDAGPSGGALPASGNILSCENAIFNNNPVGVAIKSYFTQNILPFQVKGSVFTARNWGCYAVDGASSITDYYPYVWPSASYLKTSNAATGSANDPGFKIDLFPALSGAGAVGIDMSKVGRTQLGSPNVYNSITIGDATNAANTNLFDTLAQEMRITDCNVICYNNIFRRPYKSGGGGYGISAQNSGTTTLPIINNNRTSLQLLKGAAGTHNRFYNCGTAAIYSQYYYNFKSQYTLISANNYYRYVSPSSTISFINGYAGIQLIDSAFDMHEILYDTINNVQVGVEVTAKTNIGTSNGLMNIISNVLTGLVSSSSYEYGETAIRFSDGGVSTVTPNGGLKAHRNTISGWQKGVSVTTNDVVSSVTENVVRLRYNGNPQSQFGIGITNSKFVDGVSGNEVFGDVANGVNFNSPLPTVSGAGTGTILDGVRGIYFDNVSYVAAAQTAVTCNGIHDLPIGFKFDNVNDIYWTKNSMKHNRFGILLNFYNVGGVAHPASIKTQGSACNPIDNTWDADASFPNWGGTASGSIFGSTTIYNTYVVNEDPAVISPATRLYLRTGSLPTFIPGFNGAMGGVAFSTGSGSLINTASSCSPTYTTCSPHAFRMVTSGTPEQSTLGTVDNDAVRYTVVPNPSNGEMTIQRISSELENSSADVRVINSVGQTVYNGRHNFENGSSGLMLGDVAPGLYFVHISGKNEEAAIFKVVIQK